MNRVSKALKKILGGKLHKNRLGKRLLHHGNETQKSWNPLLNTIFALRDSLECPVQWSAHNSFCAIFRQLL